MNKTRVLLTLVSAVFLTGQVRGLEIDRPAPSFTMNDIDGKPQSLSDYKGRTVVLEWFNTGCPFVKKHYGSGNMQAIQKEAANRGVVWISICSSGEGKEGYLKDDEWKKLNKKNKSNASVFIRDPEGTLGKLYGAKTTPHMFIVDPQGTLIYQGAIDDKPSADPKDVKTAKNYVRGALDESLSGKTVSVPVTQPYGCSVKYK